MKHAPTTLMVLQDHLVDVSVVIASTASTSATSAWSAPTRQQPPHPLPFDLHCLSWTCPSAMVFGLHWPVKWLNIVNSTGDHSHSAPCAALEQPLVLQWQW